LKRKICFLIRQLNQGGAQRQLLELVKNLDQNRFEISVVTFYAGGHFAAETTSIRGVSFYSLDKRGRWDLLPFLLRLGKLLHRIKPHILHAYLSTANILAVLLRPISPRTKVVWGIRSSNMDPSHYDWLSATQYLSERLLARFADLIILNSVSALDYHVAHGFPKMKCVVVSNGIDVMKFRRNSADGARFRDEHGIAANERVILMVARFDPMKDHATFLKAAALLRRDHASVRFVLVGSGPAEYEAELRKLASSLDLGLDVVWAGSRNDMATAYSGADILTLPSRFGEGFPNVVAEAMACGVPCVVTNVGDARDVVGPIGAVVEPQNHEALSAAWRDMLSLPATEFDAIRRHARERVATHFDTDTMARRTSTLLEAL
jgi:glycosyltransferase involved in cell wall biosynthesis